MEYWFLGGLIWYAIGVASFIYWWTTEMDFTATELKQAVIMGFLGPITTLICFILIIEKENKVIIKKRCKKE